MDKAVIISIIAMVFIAGVEIMCLFCCSRLRIRKTPVVAVMPILNSDTELREKLEYLEIVVTRRAAEFDRLLMIDYDAGEVQLAICRELCERLNIAEIISLQELEKNLPEMFAISR